MPNIEPTAEPTIGRDDDKDVEGHGLSAETEDSPRTKDEEESDDVEGHVLGASPNIGEPNV